MLVLSAPRLIQKRDLWMKLYLLTSLFHGLYYPVYGVAICIAFLPLAIYQLYIFVISGELIKYSRMPKFWIQWLGCLLLVLLSIEYLWGTYKHIRVMSGQSLLADAIARFGQLPFDDFIPYLSDELRIGLWYIFTFLLLAFPIWVSITMICKIIMENGKITIERIKESCIAASIPIMLLIAYLFTFNPLDSDNMFSRSWGCLLAGGVMLGLISSFAKKVKTRNVIMLTAFFVLGITGCVRGPQYVNYFGYNYSVSDNYVYINDAIISSRIGEGFMEKSQYENILAWKSKTEMLDKSKSYFGLYPKYGYYYLWGIKGDSILESNEVRSLNAAKETIDIFRKNETIVGTCIYPDMNYYLNYYILNSGEYVYSEEKGVFIPNKSDLTKEQVKEKNKNNPLAIENYDFGKNGNSFGESIEALKDIYTVKNFNYNLSIQGNKMNLKFDEELEGNEADFIYITLGETNIEPSYYMYNNNMEYIEEDSEKIKTKLMQKVYNFDTTIVIHWLDDAGKNHQMSCDLGKGNCLIPLGIGKGWLLNNHDENSIEIKCKDKSTVIPKLESIDFLKLREVL